MGKSLVKRRAQELAKAILSKMSIASAVDPATLPFADLIQVRCQRTIRKFKV